MQWTLCVKGGEYMKYTKVEGSPIRAEDAQDIGNRIEQIITKKGKIEPIDIVEDSKSENSPFNKYIKWDNLKAANLYRLHQARKIIGSVTIIVEQLPNIPQRAFVNITTEKEGSHYVTLQSAMSEPEYAQQLIEEAEDAFNLWYEQYNSYTQLRELWKPIKPHINKIHEHFEKLKLKQAKMAKMPFGATA